MVRARFLSSASGQLSKKAIFLLEKWPWRIAHGVPPEYPRSLRAGCGSLVGGDYRGGFLYRDRSIEKEVKE